LISCENSISPSNIISGITVTEANGTIISIDTDDWRKAFKIISQDTFYIEPYAICPNPIIADSIDSGLLMWKSNCDSLRIYYIGRYKNYIEGRAIISDELKTLVAESGFNYSEGGNYSIEFSPIGLEPGIYRLYIEGVIKSKKEGKSDFYTIKTYGDFICI
jgi:hypothetical protein